MFAQTWDPPNLFVAAVEPWGATRSLLPGEGQARLANVADEASCTPSNPDECRFYHLEFPGEPAQVCAPVGQGDIGRCLDRCDPYRPEVPYTDINGDLNGRWEENGCPHTEVAFSCHPLLTGGRQDLLVEDFGPLDLAGYCDPRHLDDAVGAFGDGCTTGGDAVCNPEAFCIAINDDRAVCSKLCLPYSGSAEADCEAPGFCYGLPQLQEYGVCLESDLSDGVEGDPCPSGQAGARCEADDTVCTNVGGNSADDFACRRRCKRVIEASCPEVAGNVRTCSGPALPDAPEWLGTCLAPE